MKKFAAWILIAILLIGATLSGSAETALEAFQNLTGQTISPAADAAAAGFTWTKTNEEYLDDVVSGVYTMTFIDHATASKIAPALEPLSAITAQEISDYAAGHNMLHAQVRNMYFRSLANVLRAEILINPASEERYRNIEVILSLFLEDNDDAVSEASRDTIRRSMTKEYAELIAADYSLPADFVSFIIMDDDWDDDDDWYDDLIWDYDDSPDYTSPSAVAGEIIAIGSRDSVSSTAVAELQQKLIEMGYLSGKADGIFGARTDAALKEFQLANGLIATGQYDDDSKAALNSATAVVRSDYVESYYTGSDDYVNTADYDNTPDYNTPDYNTPDYNTPDYNTPDYNTPDYNTPDYNTPEYNTPDYDNSTDYGNT